MSTYTDARIAMLRCLEKGNGIAVAGSIMDGWPFPNHQTLPNGEHMGYGCFYGITASGRKFFFQAGGASNRVENEVGGWLFSWTDVTFRNAADATEDEYASLNINREAQIKWLTEHETFPIGEEE